MFKKWPQRNNVNKQVGSFKTHYYIFYNSYETPCFPFWEYQSIKICSMALPRHNGCYSFILKFSLLINSFGLHSQVVYRLNSRNTREMLENKNEIHYQHPPPPVPNILFGVFWCTLFSCMTLNLNSLTILFFFCCVLAAVAEAYRIRLSQQQTQEQSSSEKSEK